MKILLALLVSLSLVCSIPVALTPEKTLLTADEEELNKCDPDPCPADDEETAPSLEESKEVVLTADETMEISQVDANETETENALVEYYKWSGWLNKWDGQVRWCGKCRRTALTGMYSVHANSKEDRRFQYKARTWPRGMLTNSQWWTGWTGWHRTFNIHRADAVIVTIWSFHNNGKEDRRFRFLFRRFNKKSWYKKTWRWTGLNKYDGTQSKDCGSGWMMGLWSRRSNRHRDRQFNVLCGWIVRRARKKPAKKAAAWVTRTRAVAKSTTVTNSVAVTKKQ